MAKLSDSMAEGTVVRWLVADGDPVRDGQEIVEIETDKATMSQEAEGDGLIRIVVEEGATVPVGAVIARIGDPEHAEQAPETISVSPLARRVAASLSIDLSGIRGSGPGGRILKRDVLSASSRTAPAEATAPVAGAGSTAEAEPLSRVQKTIARRMSESKATVPDFFVEVEVDARPLIALRDEVKEVEPETPSLNDFVVKAAALALRAQPLLNSSYRDGQLVTNHEVNVGIAVAGENSLLVPVIREADRLPLLELGRRSRALAVRSREGALTASDLAGGTFTVSNLGMMGVRRFVAIVNPPQAAILSVGSAALRPLAQADGSVVAAEQMIVGLSCDHRIVYGEAAAKFLAATKALLEAPLSVLTRSAGVAGPEASGGLG